MSMTGSGWSVGAQHNHNLEAMFVHAPGLKVVMPSQPADFAGLLRAAIRDDNPVLFFTDMAMLHQEGDVSADSDFIVPIGKAAVRRAGSDVTLVSYAKTVGVCLGAAEALQRHGVAAEVIDLRSLKPLDETAILQSLGKTGRLIVVHEASGLCGVAAEIAAIAVTKAFGALRAPVVRLTGPDAPSAFSAPLEQAGVPQTDQVVHAALDLMQGPGTRAVARAPRELTAASA